MIILLNLGESFKTCIFTPSKKEEYGNAKKLFYGIVFPEEIKAA
jgi:hypothetical protein